ncbi:hypothetical protein HPB49_016497 [Dermacentor silvarum]|uniref:Uncharacterized protein n=1 Tax=Dermacentor silvarum TaxID=543639 RepID=A0ACB8DEN8_DERSI|nr:uncharacterized protein LOC119440748 [Dermacentor silvarum]KAH7966458.1 hypothetical protein HPB49_016497 [Dermacentor silvarum]
MQDPHKAQYGISQTSRLLLAVAFLCFAAGGTFAVLGVASQKHYRTIAGSCAMALGVGIYTITVMFTNVSGPPSGFDLKDFESIETIKPATFQPNLHSKLALALAYGIFVTGSIMVVLGFNFDIMYLWIPGYSMSVIAFIGYTAVILYGPMTIKPGAIIVAFPDDAVPKKQQTVLTAAYTRGAPKTATEIRAARTKGVRTAEGTEYDEGDARGFQGFKRYQHCARGYTPAEPREANVNS